MVTTVRAVRAVKRAAARGVTLIEMHAQETGVKLDGMAVTIEGTRTAAAPNRFARVAMTFELEGITQREAEALVETYRGR